uniref:ribonuclease H n=1 Tax=Anolis carolinensis TaxID=28377 RepID=R4GCY5_ANOCA|nr:PREDICTED: uncharacterized protein LOC103280454 [Anolis carolinensis]|eukprot:XP_008117750.1 PREDICTED: uncharacterized protein LOC103280454 [Anolis carolinensis]
MLASNKGSRINTAGNLGFRAVAIERCADLSTSVHCAKDRIPFVTVQKDAATHKLWVSQAKETKVMPRGIKEPPNYLLKGPSPIKLENMKGWLADYPNRIAASYLLLGFSEGFRIPFHGDRRPFKSGNLRSIVGREDTVRHKIQKEVWEGRVVGPFETPPVPNLRVSPLGIMPKKAPGDFRLIHHLSFPKGESVNDAIPSELCSVRYTSFDDAVLRVRRQGPGAELAKCDIKSAFRLLPVHPQDFELLGFCFEGAYYMDRALPMGCSVSCNAFEQFSSFLEWAIRKKSGLSGVAHYLDDFLFIGKAGTGQCRYLMQQFHQLADHFGVPLAHEKTEGPATVLTFLGIEIDTVAHSCRLPLDKLENLKGKLSSFLGRRKATLREFQELMGHLNFACRVVAPGRAFLRRLCEATCGITKPHHRIAISRGIRDDLITWAEFLYSYNGVSFWRHDLQLRDALKVSSDASGSVGFGVYFNGQWCTERWPVQWSSAGVLSDLTFLEFFPIVVAVWLWASDFANSTVHFWCDNAATVQVINSMTSRSPRTMHLLRAFVLQCLRYNIVFLAHHIAGVNNGIADALSRQQMDRFRELTPQASVTPTVMPYSLWSLGGVRLTGPSESL